MTDILILTHVDYCAPGHLATVLEQHGLDFTVLRTDLNQLDGYDLKRIAASLDDAGAIADRDVDGRRRFTKRVSVNGEKHRVYVISQSALLCAIDE